MKRQAIFGRPAIGKFLVLVAGLCFSSYTMAQAANVVTEIELDVTACTASFSSTNCRGGKIPNGDICLGKGPGTAPVMVFKFKSPFPADAKIKKMDVSLNSDGTCPANVTEDFPDLTACSYSPNPATNNLQVLNKNKHERVWFYSLTLELPNCTGDITIHPLIQNGGGNN